jgi:DNA replication protein DnaC
MIQNTIDRMTSMKLYGMSDGLQEQLDNSQYKELTFEERISMLVEKEVLYRHNRKLTSLLRRASFRFPEACIEHIDFKAKRNLSKQGILKLSQNEWIKKSQNIIITGETGAGKSYIACALGNNACRNGFSTLYARIPKLLNELKISHADGSYLKLIKKLSRVDLLIMDDWGLSNFSDSGRRDMLEIFEDRYNLRSTIIATQFPVDTWFDVIGDPTIADAICDRIIHNSHKIELKATDSMRKLKANMG